MDYCSICAGCGGVECAICDRFEYFSPARDYKKYFQRKKEQSGDACKWEPGGEHLEPTATVEMNGFFICPYCGEYSFLITGFQGAQLKDMKGHCCLCRGALAELEYKKRVRLLKSLHQRQLVMLEQQFSEDMTFHTGVLKAIRKGAIIGVEADNPGYDSYFEQTPEFKKLFHLIL